MQILIKNRFRENIIKTRQTYQGFNYLGLIARYRFHFSKVKHEPYFMEKGLRDTQENK